MAGGDFAAGDGCGDEVGAGFDAVRQGGVACRFERAHAFDGECRRADAADFRAHRVQAVGEVGDFRLAGGGVEDGRAFGQHSGHQQVFGAGDGGHVHDEAGAAQFAACFDVAFVDVDVGTKRLHTFDVLVHRARADSTAAGQGDAPLAEAGEQRPEDEDAGAHGFDEFVGRFGVGDGAGVYCYLVVAGESGFGAHRI